MFLFLGVWLRLLKLLGTGSFGGTIFKVKIERISNLDALTALPLSAVLASLYIRIPWRLVIPEGGHHSQGFSSSGLGYSLRIHI